MNSPESKPNPGWGKPENEEELEAEGFVPQVFDISTPEGSRALEEAKAAANRRGWNTWRLISHPGDPKKKTSWTKEPHQ